MYWGDILYDTAICHPRHSITIGREQGNTFVLDMGVEKPHFKLAEVHPDRSAHFFFEEHHSGHVRIGDRLVSLATAKDNKLVEKRTDGGYGVHLSQQDKADLVIGHISFYLDWVEHKEKIPVTPLLDKKKALALLVFLLLFFGLVILTQKPVQEEEKPPERLVTLEPRRPHGTSQTPSNADPSKAAIGQEQSKDGGAQSGDLGKATTQAVAKPSAASSLKKANLGSLVSGLTSLGGNSPNPNIKANVAQAAVTQEGTGGFSSEGLKQGGGGKTVGIGRTSGQGEGGFSGTGRLGLYGNSSVDGAGAGGGGAPAKVAGGLDRDVIESIIRKRLDRIRLCYERQLNFYPKLSGKVSVHFVIGKAGNVVQSQATEDTMKNAAVKGCILSEVKSWTFPNPEGGTLVNVDYPFVFESGAKVQ
jgi:hypothetical protein